MTLSPNVKVIAEIKRQQPGEQKTYHPKKNLSRGSLSNWCDVDANADTDADSSKTICRTPPYLLVYKSHFLYQK